MTYFRTSISITSSPCITLNRVKNQMKSDMINQSDKQQRLVDILKKKKEREFYQAKIKISLRRIHSLMQVWVTIQNKPIIMIPSYNFGNLTMMLSFGFCCKTGEFGRSGYVGNKCDFFAINLSDTFKIFGVIEGHGPFDAKVACFVQNTIAYVRKLDLQNLISNSKLLEDPATVLKKAFLDTQVALKEQYEAQIFTQPPSRAPVIREHSMYRKESIKQQEKFIDIALSGASVTVVIQSDGTLIFGQCGNCRALIGTRRDHNNKVITPIVPIQDHLPSSINEKMRIYSSGGEVRRTEFDSQHRVYMRGRMYPALHLSRSIGDYIGSQLGVSNTPEIYTRVIGREDQFTVLGTSALWATLSNQEIGDIIGQHSNSDMLIASEGLYNKVVNQCTKAKVLVEDIGIVVFHL